MTVCWCVCVMAGGFEVMTGTFDKTVNLMHQRIHKKLLTYFVDPNNNKKRTIKIYICHYIKQ